MTVKLFVDYKNKDVVLNNSSSLSFVDLIESERAQKSNVIWNRFEEVISINLSLTTWEGFSQRLESVKPTSRTGGNRLTMFMQ